MMMMFKYPCIIIYFLMLLFVIMFVLILDSSPWYWYVITDLHISHAPLCLNNCLIDVTVLVIIYLIENVTCHSVDNYDHGFLSKKLLFLVAKEPIKETIHESVVCCHEGVGGSEGHIGAVKSFWVWIVCMQLGAYLIGKKWMGFTLQK